MLATAPTVVIEEVQGSGEITGDDEAKTPKKKTDKAASHGKASVGAPVCFYAFLVLWNASVYLSLTILTPFPRSAATCAARRSEVVFSQAAHHGAVRFCNAVVFVTDIRKKQEL